MSPAFVIANAAIFLSVAAKAADRSTAAVTSRQQASTHQAASVTPVQKVIQMLDGMKAKGKEEKHEEEVEFAKFHEWCDNVRASKTKSIKEAGEQIMQLEAKIASADADAENLAAEVADLQAAIDKAKAEAASATGQRKKENTDYTAQHLDLSESIDACGRALQVLKARTADVPQSLAQLRNSPLVPAHAKAVLTSFLALSDSSTEAGVPEANAYEFQSGGVVALVEKLERDFKGQLLALQKEEMNAKANYQLLMQQLEDNIKQDTATAGEKTALRATKLERKAEAEGDLKSTQVAKAEDEKTLSEATAECQARSEEFEKNQVTRAEEVKAIDKAVEILSSSSVSGHAETYLPKLLQVHSARALAQMQSSSGHWDPALRRKAVEFLQARSRQLGSRYLALVASRAAADPFAKVKKMVQDLIIKLSETANAEADAHAYCITELATNKETRGNKAAEVEELTATLEQLTSDSATLSSEIQELSDALAEIKGQQADATKIRQEEKATNAKTVADAKEAQGAVQRATEVLRAYYNKAASSALLQGAQGAETSQAAREPYTGQQSASTGILGMLEVVLSDFARLETETSAAEETAAAQYTKFMREADESVAVKEAEVEHKTNSRRLTDEKSRSTKKELALTQDELDQAKEYHDKLKAQCVDNGMSYDERVKAREEEIQSLKEAYAILEQSDLS
mmetsp:Transcript_136210/g.423261  ORF Transcript_136210/g.423261 Transcript_136210/m.423261 type:complete len:688 (-) Transcript_136210:102-2165(-)